MGMDVHGMAPTNKVGAYFRNNVWWWRPLWRYCCEIAPDIISDELAQACQFNDGAGLDAEGSKKLAYRLKGAIAEGHTAHYEKKYMAELIALPKLGCKWCNGTGTRTDDVGISLRMDVNKTCNGCNSTGKTDDPRAMYPFDEDNVKEFVVFLESCGGFEVR